MDLQDTQPSDDEADASDKDPAHFYDEFYDEFLSLQPAERKNILLRWLGLDGVERALQDLAALRTDGPDVTAESKLLTSKPVIDNL